MAMSLNPARSIRRPYDDMVRPCIVSCTNTTAKRPSRNTRPPSPMWLATTNGVP